VVDAVDGDDLVEEVEVAGVDRFGELAEGGLADSLLIAISPLCTIGNTCWRNATSESQCVGDIPSDQSPHTAHSLFILVPKKSQIKGRIEPSKI